MQAFDHAQSKWALSAKHLVHAISAAVVFVLGGEVAVPGGECAPAASSGYAVAGVIGDAYGPGFTQGAVSIGVGTGVSFAFRLLR